MDVYSDNFYAEMLLKEIGAVQGSGGSAAAGLAVTRRCSARPACRSPAVRMVDGSGLSLLDRWTPSCAGDRSCRRCGATPICEPYLSRALPIAGETGTLEHRMRSGPAHGLVRAKTGTTDNSSSLSGFVGEPLRLLDPRERHARFGR